MFTQIDYVMVGVSNMTNSVRFYRDILGLPLAFESKDWTEFRTGKTKLALHLASKKASGDSSEVLAGTSQIGFEVTDLDKTYHELQARGVRFVMKPQAREGEGIKLAVCLDPDGLPISIAQNASPTQAREVSTVH